MTESEFQWVASLQTPIGVLDHGLRIIKCNSSFANRCLGIFSEAWKNQILDRVLQFQNPSLLEEFKNSKLEKPIFFREQFLNSSHEELHLRGTLTRVRSGNEEVLFLEISESSESKKSKLKEKEIAAVISRLYHDLQEPIRNHNAFLKLLSDRFVNELNPKGKEFLRIARDGGERLWNRIQSLLSFLRIEKEKNIFRTLSLEEVWKNSLDPVKDDLETANANISVEGIFPRIVGNGFLLQELFTQLLSNSIRFKRPNEALILSVSCFMDDGWNKVRVRDNGIGLESKEQRISIDLFKTFHESNESAGQGTGLFFCKRIAELHGGSLEIETGLAEGFGVLIRFPKEFQLEQI
ncbi:histidine kinase [Leptospira yasudae]|nr:histidine kinase [Leptospira yasudae]